jgi:hypothetical protein
MAQCTKAGGTETKPTVREDSSTLMETSTMETGLMTKLMASESTAIWTGPSTRVNGKKTNSTDRVSRPGLMVLGMRGNTKRARSMESEPSHGLTAAST